MTQFSEWKRLMSDNPVIEEILHPLQQTGLKTNQKTSRLRIQLEIQYYELLLQHVQDAQNEIRDYRWMLHPKDSYVLQPFAIPRSVCHIRERLMVSVIKPNNCIKYSWEGKVCYAIIKQIYEYSHPYGKWESCLLVNPIVDLYPKDLESPSRHFRFTLLLLKCVVGKIQSYFRIVSSENVKTVCAYRILPDDTFGIQDGGIILRPYDYDSHLGVQLVLSCIFLLAMSLIFI